MSSHTDNTFVESVISRLPKRLYYLLSVSLLLAFMGQLLFSAGTQGQTTDEAFFSSSGYPIVRYNNYEFLGEHPPLVLGIGALPLLFIQPKFPIRDPLYVPGTDRLDLNQNGLRFLYQMGNDPNLILFLQRIPIIFLAMLLGIGILLFGTRLWGCGGGLLSLAVFSLDPNMIAHGSLYTTDMGLTVFYFFTIFALKRFFDAPSDGRVIILGLACGAGLMSKISSLILLPVITCLFVIYSFSVSQKRMIESPSIRFEKWLFGIALFLLANAIGEKQAMVLFGPFCLLAVYLCTREFNFFKKTKAARLVLKGLALGGAILCVVYSIRLKKKYGVSVSAVLTVGSFAALSIAVVFARFSPGDIRTRIMKYFLAVWVLASLVIVCGYTDIFYKFYRFIGFGNYMKPLGIVLSHSAGGHGACVEGSFITCDWKYFPGVIAVKTPVLTLALTLIGAIGLLFSKRSVLTKSIIFIPMVFFIVAAMANKIHIGLRHVLPVYPFFFLLAGYAGALIEKVDIKALRYFLVVMLTGLIFFSAARTVKAGPDYLAYFNELVGGVEQGAKLVAGSNLNWGQGNKRIAEFVINKNITFISICAEDMNSAIYDYYKIPWKMMEPGELIDPVSGYYAIGIGAYTQLNANDGPETRDQRQTRKGGESWFKGKKPLYRVGKTFYVFEVS